MHEYNEEKGVYLVNGVEVAKAAYESIHSDGAMGTNKRVHQMVESLYPDLDKGEIAKMKIKDIAEFIQADRQKLQTVKPDPKPDPKKKDEPEVDVKLILTQKLAELERDFAAKQADLKRKAAINDLRQQAITLGLREDLRDEDVFAAFARRKWTLDDTSLAGDKTRWIDAQKDQVAIGPDGKEANAEMLAKMLLQSEPNSFQTRKVTPGPGGKIQPGVLQGKLADMSVDQLLSQDL